MQKIPRIVLLALCCATTGAKAAPLLTLSGAGQTTTTVAGATVVDFNDGCTYFSCSGAFQIVLGSEAGKYAQPAGTNTSYLSVPNPVSSGTAVFGLGTIANYFGLYWGSIDSYNSIMFRNGDTVIANYSGADIVGAFANGDQLGFESNRYINFHFGDTLFDTVLLTSTNYAFESDNHAFALLNAQRLSVPEPSEQLLLLGGLVALFGVRKHLAKLRREQDED